MPTYGENLKAVEVIEDPYSYFDRLREEDPVHWNPEMETWILTRYEDLMAVFRSPEVFANDRTTFYQHYLPPGKREEYALVFHLYERWLGGNDNPRHDHMRRIVNSHWTPKKIEEQRPLVRKTIDDLLDSLEGEDRIELLRDFAYPLPSMIISAVIGIPFEDWPQVKRWSDDWGRLHFNPEKSAELWEQAVGSLKEFHDYTSKWVRKCSANPGDDYVSRMLKTDFEGDRLLEDELIVHVTEQLFAGHETSAHAITNGIHLFMRHRDQWDRLRHHPHLAKPAFEEVLRVEGPVKMITRLAKKDTTIRGKKIAAGDRILLVLAAANRDPRQFEAPDRFDISRSPNLQITFGHGVHFCLGAPLARVEGEEAFLALAERYPDLTLETEEVRHMPLIRSRALEALPLRLKSGEGKRLHA